MGAFCKRRSTKIRVINDLSWPPGESVNDFISKENSAVQYITIDDAVARVKSLGRNCLICKLDLADAYKSIVVRPADWHLLGTTWDHNNGVRDFYIDHVLPFGLRSSAQLFNLFATALEFCMLQQGTTHASHYLDDYMSSGRPDSDECANNLKIMISTCEYLGMEVNFNKVVEPATTMEFLGIVIDTNRLELRMSQERLDDVIQELTSWKERGSGIKRDLLSLLGKLVFLCRIVRPGRIFLRRLFNLTSKLRYLHHRIKLTIQARKDIDWWLRFVLQWNKRSMFYEDDWITSPKIELATDASNLGYGGVLGHQWFMAPVTPSQKELTIAWRELYAIIIACTIWGPSFSQKRLIIYCDNLAIVFSVNAGSSKCPKIMALIRVLFNLACVNNFEVRLKHVPGLENIGPDRLSRLDLKAFREFDPEAELTGHTVPVIDLHDNS